MRSSSGSLPDSICSTIFSSRPIAPSKLSSASRAFGLLLMGKTEELSTGWAGEKADLIEADNLVCHEFVRVGSKPDECNRSYNTMRAFQWLRQAKASKQEKIQAPSYYGMWDAVARFAAGIRASDFMAEMIRRRDAFGSEGVMGAIDCATLYGLTRWARPAVIVESGGFIGMSSAFILKALADEKLATARLYSIELSQECDQGALIPDDLRSSGRFMPMCGRIEDFLKYDELPASIDMFLHDSSHSYRH